MDKKSIILGSALIAAIICFALIVAVLFACPFTVPQGAGAPPPSQQQQVSNLPNASINASPAINASPSPDANASPPDRTERDWAMINRSNVENACLSQAKKTAVASGYDEWLVFSCACSAQELAGAKSYECSVSALDGAHPVSINCTKSDKACRIAAQGSESTYTFDQLQVLANP